ncbi:hypothetical protein [Paenirhodobacter sp.]|uniref:hypothetical protein n=1 Tax=Paenirhodobacter sp. TaxID=1965326 RepID=UPI003B40C194
MWYVTSSNQAQFAWTAWARFYDGAGRIARRLKEYIGSAVIGISILLAFALIFVLFLSDSIFTNESTLGDKSIEDFNDISNYLEHYKAEYIVWAMGEQVQHHEWNLRSTKFLFWLSTLVSVSGIAFSFWQFTKADEYDKRASEADEVTLKNSVAELSFKSRSIASFILSLSLIYLFVYVKFLYPIQNLPERPKFEASVDAPQDDSSVSSEARSDGDVASD